MELLKADPSTIDLPKLAPQLSKNGQYQGLVQLCLQKHSLQSDESLEIIFALYKALESSILRNKIGEIAAESSLGQAC